MKQQTLLIILGIAIVLSFVLLSTRIAAPRRSPIVNQETNISIATGDSQAIEVIPADQKGGKLIMNPSDSSLTVGRAIEMEVNIDAPGITLDGADVVISYDPRLVRVGAIGNNTANTDLSRGPYFLQLVRTTVDQTAGKITVTGFSPREEMLQKEDTNPVAMFSFPVTALQPGVATFHIEYQPGRSDLSTLVEQGTSKNILTGVHDAVITIGG